MKKANLMLLVVACGTVLASCGNDKTSAAESVEIGNSVYAGVVVNYAGNSNLLGVSVLTHLRNDGYAYTPKVNDTIYLVPSFAGANELDYMTINGQRVEAKTGTAEDVFSTYSGPLSLEGIKYCSYTQPNGKVTIDVASKAVTGATLHTVTLNIVDNTDIVERYDLVEEEWTNVTGDGIDSYFGTPDTHTVEIIEGAWASYLIQGEDIDNYHDGVFSYTAKIGEKKLFGNTLESNINEQMKTTASFVMPNTDVTVDITMANAFSVGKAYGLVHAAGYVGEATVTTATTHSGTSIVGATLREACLPTYVTIANDEIGNYDANDYVDAEVTSHGETSTVHYYKTISFGDYTLTGAVDGEGKFSYTGADFTEAAVCEAWYNACAANTVLANGTKPLGSEYLKESNGYWSGPTYPLGWEGNRNITCGVFVEYGPEALANAEKATEGEKHWHVEIDGEDVDLGMTWNDFNSVKEGSNSYLALLTEAYNASLPQA